MLSRINTDCLEKNSIHPRKQLVEALLNLSDVQVTETEQTPVGAVVHRLDVCIPQDCVLCCIWCLSRQAAYEKTKTNEQNLLTGKAVFSRDNLEIHGSLLGFSALCTLL